MPRLYLHKDTITIIFPTRRTSSAAYSLCNNYTTISMKLQKRRETRVIMKKIASRRLWKGANDYVKIRGRSVEIPLADLEFGPFPSPQDGRFVPGCRYSDESSLEEENLGSLLATLMVSKSAPRAGLRLWPSDSVSGGFLPETR